MTLSPALRSRFNAGFQVFTKVPNLFGVPVATKGGGARHVYWSGFLDIETATTLRPAKLAVIAYAHCDVLRQWIYLQPDQYVVGRLRFDGKRITALAVLRDGLPIIATNPAGRLVTDPDSPIHGPGFA